MSSHPGVHSSMSVAAVSSALDRMECTCAGPAPAPVSRPATEDDLYHDEEEEEDSHEDSDYDGELADDDEDEDEEDDDEEPVRCSQHWPSLSKQVHALTLRKLRAEAVLASCAGGVL